MNKNAKIILISVLILFLIGLGAPYAYHLWEQNALAKYGLSDADREAARRISELRFNIYLKREVTKSQAEAFKNLLQGQSWAESVVYTSSEQLLQDFKQEHKNDLTINQALVELAQNPLLSKVELHIKECSQNKTAGDFLQKKEFYPLIERMQSATGCRNSGM